MAGGWLLIETLDHSVPSVIAQGSAVKNMVPVETFFKRSKAKSELLALISRVCTTAEPERITLPGNRFAVTEAICNDWGQVHGLWLRIIEEDEQPLAHDRAWAFVWNLTRGRVTRSKGLAPEGSPEEQDRREWSIAEAFNILETGSDASETLVKIINADPGTIHQTTWPQKRPDGTLHDVNFAVRILLDHVPGRSGADDRILRGISHDLGEANNHDDPESPIMLAELVAATSADPGEYRAIVDVHSLRLLRWYGEPSPELVWEYEDLRRLGQPPIHPEDNSVVERMQRELDTGRAVGQVRFMTKSGNYQPFDLLAKLIVLNRSTTAALVTFRKPLRPFVTDIR
ncbi:GAF domain-containing protein [Nocardia macrotermitis]|uniref:Rv3651-like N-terminal domain-containing protein n=1 Tax=Nocardia macrotermitis TaxID=2585198 RepID=A0A7K0DEZ6_9NOCA|nr:GAF domain-containing protein [Nocardia macrotermitis]MQY24356.1 hypothetical protein [Nocardia macrotermitis]